MPAGFGWLLSVAEGRVGLIWDRAAASSIATCPVMAVAAKTMAANAKNLRVSPRSIDAGILLLKLASGMFVTNDGFHLIGVLRRLRCSRDRKARRMCSAG